MLDFLSTPLFDNKYYFDGELGAIYSKENTVFRLWAPLASRVVLKLKRLGLEERLSMKRVDKGVFEILVNGDLDGAEYLYEVTNNEITVESIDPYAKASMEDGRASVVLDLEELRLDKAKENLPAYKNYIDTIIYEGNVRDLTIGRHTNIENKGKYLGFVEEGRKTKGGHPAGIDYLKYLGITHVQLNPIFDFDNVKDDDVSKSYNWGYDITSFFALFTT